MTPLVSKIAVITQRSLEWLDKIAKKYQVDIISSPVPDLVFLDDEQYDLLLIDDEAFEFNVAGIIDEVNRTQHLTSVIVLTNHTDPTYALEMIELGAADVLNLNDDESYLTRRLNLALKSNHSKRASIRHNRNLNAVTILSRRMHNANHPTNLIVDTLDSASTMFNLMGFAIILESDMLFHLRVGTSSVNANRRIYDVMVDLHPYSPIYQVISKGLVMVFEDISLNPYMIDLPIFEKLHSAIILPLRYSNITLGAIVALGTEANPLTRDDIVIYEHVATHIGSAYQNVRQSYTQDVTVKTSTHLLRAWQHLSKVYAPQKVDKIIRILASEVTGVKHALVWLYKETSTDLIVNAPNLESHRVFLRLYSEGVINEYLNQFDTQLRPLIIWLGRSNTKNIGELFRSMEGQQLILVPIKDEARLLGCILVSSNNNNPMTNEYISLLEGVAHAAGQTLARNMVISYQNEQTQRLEAITRSIKDGVFFVSERQEVVFCNPQFTELTGISPSLVLNNPIQALLDELSNRSVDPQQTRQQLDDAIQQIKNKVTDPEYPIIDIKIPEIDTHLFIEFVALSENKNDDPSSWVGILRSGDHIKSTNTHLLPALMNSTIAHLYMSVKDMNSELASLCNHEMTAQQDTALSQVKKQSQEVAELINNVKNLIDLEQNELVTQSSNDPNEMLSVILNKAPLLQYSERLDIKISVKNVKLDVNRQYIMQTFTNLIELGLQLSDAGTLVQVYMGVQANRLIFRVISKGPIIEQDLVNRILLLPDESYQGITYANQLRLYSSHQAILRHGGQFIIKEALLPGMQFNVLLPINTSPNEEFLFPDDFEIAPERKQLTVMIYDDNPHYGDVDYSSLESQDYELIYCDEINQIYAEVEIIRVNMIIITTREQHESTLHIVEQLRQKKKVTIPILVLSTDNTEDIRVRSLRAGVDAYVSLPISNVELLAQMRNLFERSKLPERVHKPLAIGKLYIDFSQRLVLLDGKNVSLTRIEYELLSHLALKSGETVTQSELLVAVWGPEYREEKQYLWVNMSRLRRKLKKSDSEASYIFTQPGFGYILKDG